MKKILFLLTMIFMCINVDAQYVIGSSYKPLSFDEIAAPLIMAKKFQEECINRLETLAEHTEQAERFINKENDPKTWSAYADCYNSIIDEYNSILKQGTSQSTRRNISELKRRSSALLASIRAAYDRRNSLANDQYARLRSEDGLMCSRYFSDISIDEFMNGSTPSVTYQTREEYNSTHR